MKSSPDCFIIFNCYYYSAGNPVIYPKEFVVCNCLSFDFLVPESGHRHQNRPVFGPNSAKFGCYRTFIKLEIKP